jgi:glycosyltransferase involved in cell wall biosynthesis
VVEPRGKGGMIHYAYQLCSGFADNGAEVTLITSTTYELDGLPHNFKVEKKMRLWETMNTRQRSSNFLGRLIQKAFKYLRRGYRGIRYITEWYRMVRFLPKLQPDFILFGKIEFPFEAIFLRYLKNKGLILGDICHEFERRELSRSFIENWYNKLYNNAFENFSTLFFHANNNLERFQELFDISPERLKIIDHGNENIFIEFAKLSIHSENLRVMYNLEENANIVLFFGLLSPSKGIPDLIDAFAIVVDKYPTVKLLIAGYPSKYVDPQDYKNQVEKLKLRKNIIFDLRYIPNESVAELMNLAKVVVYPYTSSTQSGALQVAYSFGKPVIVTDVGGLPEVVEHGKSGLIVPPHSTNELAAAISSIIEDPEKAETMGSYAKHLSDTRFSWKTITAQIIADVQSGIAPKKATP